MLRAHVAVLDHFLAKCIKLAMNNLVWATFYGFSPLKGEFFFSWGSNVRIAVPIGSINEKTPSSMDVAPWADHWFTMVLDGSVWFCMVFDGIQRYSILSHGIEWYCMVFNAIRLYLMVSHGILGY